MPLQVFGPALTNFVIRHTFYKQFVAGESVEACAHTLDALRACSVGGITYCAESEGAGPLWARPNAAR